LGRVKSTSYARLVSLPLGIVTLGIIAWHGLNLTDFGLFAVCLVLSQLFGTAIAVNMQPATLSTDETSSAWQHAMSHVFLRWIAAILLLGFPAAQGKIPLFKHEPTLIFAIAGAMLAIATLMTIASFKEHDEKKSFFGSISYFACCVAVCGGAIIAEIKDPTTLLGLYLFFLLVTSGLSIRGMPSLFDVAKPQKFRFRLSVHVVLRNIDVILISIVLDGATSAIYLIARAIAAMTPTALRLLDHATLEHVARTYVNQSRAEFCSAAARLNLGYLLIGGAGSLFAIGVAEVLSGNALTQHHGFQPVFFWLILASASPTLFGATNALMKISKMENALLTLQLLAAFFVCFCAVTGLIQNGIDLARYFALSQLTMKAACAVILGLRVGIWPGITAVFFGQIRII